MQAYEQLKKLLKPYSANGIDKTCAAVFAVSSETEDDIFTYAQYARAHPEYNRLRVEIRNAGKVPWHDIADLLKDVDLPEFLSWLPGELVSDPQGVMDVVNYQKWSQPFLFQLIIAIWDSVKQIYGDWHQQKKDRKKACYDKCCGMIRNMPSESVFNQLFSAVVEHNLDITDKDIPEEIQKVNDDLNRLLMSKKKKLMLAKLCAAKTVGVPELEKIYGEEYVENNSKDIRRHLNTIINYPIDFLCCIEADPQNTNLADIRIGYEYAVDAAIKSGRAIILNPDPYFIRKWMRSEKPSQTEACFVVPADMVPVYRAGLRGQKGITVIPPSELQKSLQANKERTNGNFCIVLFGDADGNLAVIEKEGVKPDSIVRLCAEERIEKYKEYRLLGCGLHKVILMPVGTNSDAKPKKRIIAEYEQGYQSIDLELQRFGLYREQSQILVLCPRYVKADNTEPSLREAMRKGELPSGKKRERPLEIPFSEELSICVKTSPEANGTLRAEAYFIIHQKSKKVSFRNISRKVKAFNSSKDIENWAKEEYPFSDLRRNGETTKTGIRDSVAKAYREAPTPSADELTVKTLWYLFPELESGLSDADKRWIATMLLSNTKLESVVLGKTSESIIRASLEGLSAIEQKRTLYCLQTIVDSAVDNGILKTNCFDGFEKNNHFSSARNYFAEIRSALTKKSLSIQEFKRLIAFIKLKIEKGFCVFVLLLVRCLTGLESNIVCALLWGDFFLNPDTGVFSLRVSKQVSNDGSEVKPLEKPEEYRLMPCMDVLAKTLSEAKKRLAADLEIEESELDQYPIGYDGQEPKVVSPRELERVSKDALKELGIPDNVIYVPDDGKGLKMTNLAHYNGDFFRENMRWFLIEKAKADEGVVAFILGNKPELVFSGNYCDYNNIFSQQHIYVILQRINAVLSEEDSTTATEKTCRNVLQTNLSVNSGTSSMMALISIKNNLDEVSVNIESKYGIEAKGGG